MPSLARIRERLGSTTAGLPRPFWFLWAGTFVNRAGSVAEEQGHHPEITLGWGHAKVEIWTHKIEGLTESDFILAAKYDRLQGA